MKAKLLVVLSVLALTSLLVGATSAQGPDKPGSPGQGFVEASSPPPPTSSPAFRRAAEEALRRYLGLQTVPIAVARIQVSPVHQESPQATSAATKSEWPVWTSPEFGYAITYPPEWSPQEKADISQAVHTKVPSDVQFGDVVHLVVRIPRLDDETFERWTQAWQIVTVNNLPAHRWEAIIASPWDGEEFLAIQYVFRTPNTDYLLSYSAPLKATSLLGRFERMAQSFRLIGSPAYHPPVQTQSTTLSDPEPTDGFDFPVDPHDGSAGRPPDYASYNVQNPYLSSCGDNNRDGKDDCWSGCYQKWLSQLQHAGEDWFRPAGSNIYAVANGRVIPFHADSFVVGHQ